MRKLKKSFRVDVSYNAFGEKGEKQLKDAADLNRNVFINYSGGSCRRQFIAPYSTDQRLFSSPCSSYFRSTLCDSSSPLYSPSILPQSASRLCYSPALRNFNLKHAHSNSDPLSQYTMSMRSPRRSHDRSTIQPRPHMKKKSELNLKFRRSWSVPEPTDDNCIQHILEPAGGPAVIFG